VRRPRASARASLEERPRQQRTNGFGMLIVLLQRHVERDAIDMVHFARTTPRIDMYTIGRVRRSDWATGVEGAIVEQYTIATPERACGHVAAAHDVRRPTVRAEQTRWSVSRSTSMSAPPH